MRTNGSMDDGTYRKIIMRDVPKNRCGDVADERPDAGDEGLGVQGHGVPASPSRSAGIVIERRSAR